MPSSQSWSFKDRSFLIAVGASLLWHFFWFFLIHVTVIPSRSPLKPRPRVVALGSVLDDSIFKTLVETKPQFSETFYRRLSDFSKSIEPPIRTMERHASGEVVSLPLGKKIGNVLRHWLGGEKLTPAYEFTRRFQTSGFEEGARIEGDVRNRPVLSRPDRPRLSAEFREQPFERGEIQLGFSVQPSGAVRSVDVLLSSGRSVVDEEWMHYLKGWQFAPLDIHTSSPDQRGKATFRLRRSTRD